MSTDVHTLSGAYALDALSPEEAEEFRRHLAGCHACHEEVRELQAAAARMGAGQAAVPPPELKDRILAAADRTPQIPPSREDRAPRSLSDTGSDASSGSNARARKAAARRWQSWAGAAAAAVIMVGGGVIGVSAILDQDDPGLSEAAAQVFEAGDARTATVKTANGGRLTVGVSPSRNEMAVDTRDLPELESGRVYQLWAVRGEEAVSAAVVSDREVGAAMEMPAEETQVAVTVEPRGGSEQPTSPPIVSVDPREV